jgi:SAM-dependent methyltransferase
MPNSDIFTYYNANADAYFKRTQAVSLAPLVELFLKHVPKGGKIVDLGCGTGRWARTFIDKGYDVIALDGAENMVALAKKQFGVTAKLCLYEDFLLSETEQADAIWAMSSLVHYPPEALQVILRHIARSLKVGGVLYTSFKPKGFGHRAGDTRYFNQFTPESFNTFLKSVEEFALVEPVWQSASQEGPKFEWLNVLLRKVA